MDYDRCSTSEHTHSLLQKGSQPGNSSENDFGMEVSPLIVEEEGSAEEGEECAAQKGCGRSQLQRIRKAVASILRPRPYRQACLRICAARCIRHGQSWHSSFSSCSTEDVHGAEGPILKTVLASMVGCFLLLLTAFIVTASFAGLDADECYRWMESSSEAFRNWTAHASAVTAKASSSPYGSIWSTSSPYSNRSYDAGAAGDLGSWVEMVGGVHQQVEDTDDEPPILGHILHPGTGSNDTKAV